MALCAALHAWPLDWGLPSEHGWAPDELTPAAVLEGMSQRFSNGWHAKYPPFHYAVLAAAYVPWLQRAPDAGRHHALFRAGRLVSLLMAAGTVVLVYLCGRELFDHLPALFAALVAGLSAPFAYYAKLANLDVPYLFWFSAALLAYLRLLQDHRLRHYVALGACAAAAVATKDQAYGLFVLVAPVVAWALHRHRRATGASPSPWATLADRRLAAAALTASLGLIVLDNIGLNPRGFAAHVELILGSASRDFRMFDRSPAGLAALAAATLRALVFTLGAPAAAAAVLGVGLAVARGRENRLLLATLVPAASYWLCFVAVVLYLYDRFVLPIAIVLALFAGKALAEALARRRSLALAAAGAIVVLSALRAASVDVLLARDSRYAVEAWLREHAPPPALVAAVGPLEYLPRLDGLRWRRLGPSMDRLRRVDPDVVVVNADYARRAAPGGGEAELYEALAGGRAGYRPALAQPASTTLPFLDLSTIRGEDPARVHSNLDKVGPEILVYAREGADR